jgi:hypothetical protein
MAQILKQANICIECRKVFKKPFRVEDEKAYPCPQCGLAMRKVGPTFRAPTKSDTKEWEKVEYLLAKGFKFHEGEGRLYPRKKLHPDAKSKGLKSIFQVPARKRHRYEHSPQAYRHSRSG